ncbi:MAG: Heme/hemopexin transporter protein HuxB [Syntrophus sp. SKADARSKE-3]|nr:Heme/hemopexin transporter protein HuxB [Syntrophus sp. SKADARSKE-3]
MKKARKSGSWLLTDVLQTDQRNDHSKEAVLNHCRAICIDPFGLERLKHNIPFAVLIFLAICGVSHAAPTEIPDAGILMDSIREKQQPLPPAKPVINLPEAELQAETIRDTGIKIKINSFRITGNTVFKKDDLLPLVAENIGKEISLAGLQKSIRKITEYYQIRGYLLARAYLPAQKIKDGVVEIAVLEGKLGLVELRMDKVPPLAQLSAQRVIKGAIREGDVINEKGLEKTILLLRDILALDVQATLKPGTTIGTTDLLLELSRKPPFSVSLDGDNQGNRYTGYYRSSLQATANNLSGLGESMSVRGMTSGEGMLYGRVNASFPVGYWGSRIGASYSQMKYKLGDDFSNLDASGNAKVTSLYMFHPLIRSRRFNLYTQLQYDYKTMEDKVDVSSSITEKTLHVGTLSLSLDAMDEFWGGGVTNLNLSGVYGKLNLQPDSVLANDSLTARTDGFYEKALLMFSRRQQLFGPFSLSMLFNGQYSTTNLDSSEKFPLGGPNAVRSYPVNEASGDRGYTVTGELIYIAPRFWEKQPWDMQFTGFIDYGEVRINNDLWPGALGTGNTNTRHLSGAGVGFNLMAKEHFSLKMSYAWKLGHEESTSDVDRSGRFWITANIWF